jgi:hypothetical protein
VYHYGSKKGEGEGKGAFTFPDELKRPAIVEPKKIFTFETTIFPAPCRLGRPSPSPGLRAVFPYKKWAGNMLS